MIVSSLRLTHLLLQNFRSHVSTSLRLRASAVVVVGENGTGKTNLLEAVSLLGPGRGLRGARNAEFGRRAPEGMFPWAVSGRFEGPQGAFDLGTGTPPDGSPDKRVLRLDGNPVRSQMELTQQVTCVWLTPQMDRLFGEGASGRRRFLDRLVWALEPGHAREVAAYDNSMAQRNRLLASGQCDAGWLASLEDAMARHGVAVTAARLGLVSRLNAVLEAGTAGTFPAARCSLACEVVESLRVEPALAVEDRLREALRTGRPRDAAAGAALAGPHRCDLLMTHLPKGLPAELCSTGEQKALLVSVVLGHAALIAAARGFAPILLLDEVAAHLDVRRREALFAALLALPAQCFLTGTEAGVFASLLEHGSKMAECFRTEAAGVLREDDYGVREIPRIPILQN